jgi:rhodanese-related sulfurtransferase
MLPLDLTGAGKLVSYLGFFGIGMAFGGVLEVAGFGDSRKLAAQFYLKDMTVLKVMFTGILTACLLVFGSASLGLLDFSQLFVNPTFLWPGIVGGLIMGVGFVIGGYCPGTSVVAAASLKLDGLTFFLGAVIGAGVFGESVNTFRDFWNGSHTERLLLSDWFGWSIGGTVVGVTILALVFFYAAEKVEERFGTPEGKVTWRPRNKAYVLAAAVALGVSLVVWVKGQPSPEARWDKVGAKYEGLLAKREVFIEPLEYAKTWGDPGIKLVTLDLRPKAAFEQMHLTAAQSVSFEQLADKRLYEVLDQLPPQGVVVLVDDDEDEATRAWKRLKVEGVTNLYVLEHGMVGWKEVFSNASHPSLKVLDHLPKDAFKPKIKLKTTARAAGVCG